MKNLTCSKCGTPNLEIVYDSDHDDLVEVCMKCGHKDDGLEDAQDSE